MRVNLATAKPTAMNMPEIRNTAELQWTRFDYTGPIQIMMAGGWNDEVDGRRVNEILATVQTHVNVR